MTFNRSVRAYDGGDVGASKKCELSVNDEKICWRALGNVIGTARADALRITAS